ncbi:MAG TPA: SDR family oxidoreductase [Chthoniobacterales bacterium]|jgi:short-subunit dehydrogenase|nr:SDR family oxidoreductase [Chthoniobacterales bacterium]
MASFSYRNKIALITGGSRGLGLEIARQICARGGNVALIARDSDELAGAKTDLDRFATEVLTMQCDLLETAQIQSAVQQTLRRFGKIDILINNAGTIEIGPVEHMLLKDFDRAMRLHFWAPFILYLLVAPQMRANGGRIVNISSIGGRIAVPHMAAYSASKFALTGFSDAIRAELARDNIFVTTVTPGLMRTGSHIHAKFKGDHSAEYKWFDWSRRLPFASISVEGAARKILSACGRGKPNLVMPWSVHFIIAANALLPNLTARVMKIVNRSMPPRVSKSGDEARSGADVRGKT